VERSPRDADEAFDNQIVTVSLGDFNPDRTALKAALHNG